MGIHEPDEAKNCFEAILQFDNADFFKLYGGRKPNIVSVNGKPINLNEDEAEEEDEKSLTSSDQKAESTETTTEPSNDLRKFFSRHFLHDVDCGMNLDFRYFPSLRVMHCFH